MRVPRFSPAVCAAAACAGQPLALVEDGRLAARLECGATPPELLASNEYYRVVSAVTGCAVDAAARAAAPNRLVIRIAGDPEANDEIAIVRSGSVVTLTGNNARAAAGAVYRLLEELGCRWYWADADGEYLPSARRGLSVGDLDIRERAAFKYRQLSTHPVRGKYAFLAHNRANMLMGKTRGFIDWGGSGHWGGHSFGAFVPACKVHPNLMVTYCQYNRCYRHALGDTNCLANAKSLKAVRAWWEKLDHMPDIYGYHYDAFDWPKPLLLPIWDVLQDEIRWCRKGGIRFYKTEFYGGDCAKAKVQRFSSYALLKLFWNPDLDLDALMTEYADRVFGPAGPEMKAYWQLLAKSWAKYGKCIAGYGNKPGPFASHLMTKEVKAEARRLFAAGRAKLAAGTRERRELEAEFGYFTDWADITRSRDEWTAIADRSDPARVAALKAAEPAETLYPQPGRKNRPTAIDWEPEAVLDAHGAFKSYRNTSDGLLYGNHPGVFADEFWLPCQWVNYQLDFDFRYPKNPRGDGYRMGTLMRWHGERFEGHPFGSVNFRIDRSGIWAAWVYERFEPKRGPVETKFGQGKVAPLDDGWHHFSGRVADSAYVVKVDGVTLYEADDVAPVGRGMINVCTGTHPPCPLAITNLTVRAIHAPGDPFETDERPVGKARVDGSGRMVYE